MGGKIYKQTALHEMISHTSQQKSLQWKVSLIWKIFYSILFEETLIM